jgi:hypothetical protein
MKNIIFVALFFFTAFFSSCMAVQSGSLANSAALSSANFDYAKQNVSGYASSTYVLGIGGLKRDNLVNDAKLNMLNNHSLKSNQALTNHTVTFKTSNFFGIIQKVECFVNADVVEFRK